MALNLEKCKKMHIGKKNPKSKYFLDNSGSTPYELEESMLERDLGVLITNDYKVHQQVINVCGKANRIIGMLKHTFVSRDLSIWSKLYKTYIRPNLEFAVSAWYPYKKQDINLIEKIQRRVTKIPLQCRNMPYENRCKLFSIQPLDKRRIRGDMIQQFKIIKKNG